MVQKIQANVVIIAAAKVGGIIANSKYPYDFLAENLEIQQILIENSFETEVKTTFPRKQLYLSKYAVQPIAEEELLNGILEKLMNHMQSQKLQGLNFYEALENKKV